MDSHVVVTMEICANIINCCKGSHQLAGISAGLSPGHHAGVEDVIENEDDVMKTRYVRYLEWKQEDYACFLHHSCIYT
jgi:hypothetical protein